ncbi:MAG: ABC transporter substrate-binding protein [Chryseoglobus sp.]|nr:ABC transporter substrate-binding protein [Microcella sp.]MBX9472356.1 ABC transporter substrate-binding protein [Microcella sp.]
MKTSNTKVGLGVALAFTLLIAGCSSDATPAEPNGDADPIIAGALFSMTGPLGPTGERILAGVQIGIDEVNASGGVLGRQIELISADDEGTAAVAVNRAQELVAEDIDVVFEGVLSTVSLASQPIFARAGVMDVTITAAAPDILAGTVNPDAVRLNADNDLTAQSIADYINAEGYENVVVLQQNDVYGDSQGGATIAALDNEPSLIIRFDPKQTDFRVEMEQVIAADPDLVLIVNASSDTGGPAMLSQLRSAGYDGPFTMAPTTLTPTAIELAGGAADGGISTQAYIFDQEPFVSYPGTQRLVEAYKAFSDDPPTHEVAFAYTAVLVWAAAAEAAGNLERSAVAAEIKGNSFDNTAFGEVSFDDKGQMSSTLQLYRVENGEIVTF